MIATLDANVLVYASSPSSDRRAACGSLLERISVGDDLVYLFWPTAMAYLRIVTHPSVFEHPLDPDTARKNLASLLDRPQVRTAGEGDRFWPIFREVAADADPRGNLVPDAHLVALMLEHGVRTIWTYDRDFRRFSGIDPREP